MGSKVKEFLICRAERHFSKSIFDTIKKCFETQMFFHSFKLFKLFKNTFSFGSKILVRKKNHGRGGGRGGGGGGGGGDARLRKF